MKVKEIPPKEDLVMTNKELEVIVCNAIDARKEQGTPFDRDAFVALVKMALKRLDLKVDTCTCLSALAEKL